MKAQQQARTAKVVIVVIVTRWVFFGHSSIAVVWRLRVSCGSTACVIAQRRVQPLMVNGNPLTEHKQLYVRSRVCAHQQVPLLTGWK